MKQIEKVEFSPELLKKVTQVPNSPGIYQYLNSQNKIIYIGKSKNLKNRVRSYFSNFNSLPPKTQALVEKIANIEIIIVDSETEALILEDTLIKKYKPHYNIMLKDDKTYPYVKITKEPFPQIFITRNVFKDGAKYIGPFTGKNIKYILKSVQNIFQIRTCRLKFTEQSIKRQKFRSCLNYHIGKCNAPCIGEISVEEYNNNVKMAHQVLLGRTKTLTNELENTMYLFSENMEYEKAARIRNQIKLLKDFTTTQKIITPDQTDRDIFGIARVGDYACTLVFIVREGKLIGKRHFLVSKADGETNEVILQKTLEKYYLNTDFVPKEIYLPNELEDIDYILDWLTQKRLQNWQNYFENINEENIHKNDLQNLKNEISKFKATISILFPKIGDKKKLLDMANTNAQFELNEYILGIEIRDKAVPRPVLSLQRDLNLSKPPRRIECYDNSHIQGSDMVSSMVVFVDGKPRKSEYRKFKAIKEVKPLKQQNDDFAQMRDTIRRRFKRLIEEEQELPDLVIVDGGKGQLSSAFSILQELKLDTKIHIIGLAKRLEEVFFYGVNDPIMLPKTSSSLKLIQQLRDEAHRFAITFHRQLRSKRSTISELDNIKWIGQTTIKKLIEKFGSVQAIKSAKENELTEILSIKQLQSLKEKFNEI